MSSAQCLSYYCLSHDILLSNEDIRTQGGGDVTKEKNGGNKQYEGIIVVVTDVI